MICFEVKRNGARLCTAGINSKCILSAIVTHVDVIDPGPKPRRTLDLLVSGLNTETKQHMNWRRVDLKSGDRVEIRVIESAKADSPARIAKSQTRKNVCNRRARSNSRLTQSPSRRAWESPARRTGILSANKKKQKQKKRRVVS
jgi:hypothetical protein